jgi:signal transduction histidine kinase
MLKTLYGKLVTALIVLFLLIGGMFILVTRYSTDLYQQEVSQRLNETLAQNIAKEKQLISHGEVDRAALEEVFHMLMVINPSIELYTVNPQGKLLAYSAPEGHVKRQAVDLQPVQRFLNGDAMYPLRGDDPRGYEREKVFSAAPIYENGALQGYLYIILGSEAYDNVAHMLQSSHILRLSTGVMAISLLVAVVAGALLFFWLTRRLRHLSGAMAQFQNSDFSDPVTLPASALRGRDEISRLTGGFQSMANRIIEQVDQLRKTDAQRREMVANVSHDLRTPLASLQGYLETILIKGDQLSPEEQKQYIEIATRHSKDLAQLVEELFELAKLDSLETLVHCEPLSLTELAQDVIQKFELSAQKKGITLTANFDRDLPHVSADIGMMVRVLENLIENALRHTPEGGTISLELIPGTENITVRVSDTGCGIPEDEIPHIFDRFYRLEKSREAGKGGAGLGLAIVRRILELHGSEVVAESEAGKGARFWFELPVVG